MLSGETTQAAKVSDATTPESTPPADKVAANDYLLTEILLRLPIKSLLRFKSVSKHCLSLIANPYFSRRRQPSPYTPSGLLLHPFSSHCISPQLDFIPLHDDDNPSDSHLSTVTSFPGLPAVKILNSCNGLLCCSNFYRIGSPLNYYIYNPTTKQYTTLPQPVVDVQKHVDSLNLAFDPSTSPFYKVVCVWSTLVQRRSYFQIEIYSSETRHWRKSGELFTARNMDFQDGVYWNGAINWVSFWGDSLYFNVDEERLGTLPMLPVRDGRYNRPRGKNTLEWFVKYRIDLDGVANANPEMIGNQLYPAYFNDYAFVILSLVRGQKDEESFLVLHIPGKVIRYNFGDKSFKKLCDVALRRSDDAEVTCPLRYADYLAFEYMECLSCV
ncbi:hypothetical protein F0562_031417 [Nyssa sinensis]|uniref:Uncharacterized protein n=1 Tax=Nyssa sinensis TaxID=561372 RepID=A0A5J5ATU8_9ASTE|nr:hypothetical protein F0562_031417 [Nyssa sinensis]